MEYDEGQGWVLVVELGIFANSVLPEQISLREMCLLRNVLCTQVALQVMCL